MLLVTILGPVKAGVLVDVLDLDPALIGKAFQPSRQDVVDTTSAKDNASAVQAAYPTAQVFGSMDERRPTIEQLLIDAGLRQKDVTGKLEFTARAARIDARLEAP